MDAWMDAAHRGASALPETSPVQARGELDAEDPAAVHRAAAAGVSGGGSAMPHFDRIQQSFGGALDLSEVRAHVGGEATAASEQMGASAYATGNHVAFAGQPDLHTAAHEAAHVVQQRAGVQLAGGVGAKGDAYERHADAVADAVTRGESAEALLGQMSGAGPAGAAGPVQRKISFKVGGQRQFNDIEDLKRALHSMFDEAHHVEIDEIVDATQAQGGRALPAVYVFNQVVTTGEQDGWARVAQPSSSTNHGPQLPRFNATGTGEDMEAAMSSFMFPSVTMGRADLILPSGDTVSFEGRQTGPREHAEDVLLRQITEYVRAERVDPRQCRLRITLNNLPCHDGKGEKNCSETLRSYAVGAGFAAFHLYYTNNYGENVPGSIANMQNAGIGVSQFAPRDVLADSSSLSKQGRSKVAAKGVIPPRGAELDPWSESESESDVEMELEDAGLPGELRDVSGSGLNCLIRALLVAAGFGELEDQVQGLRQQLVEGGVAENGQMLDLANAAGALLISQIAPGRGVVVYTPERRDGITIVAGLNPVRLWLAGEHFQAIL